jgi:hypothetical protein
MICGDEFESCKVVVFRGLLSIRGQAHSLKRVGDGSIRRPAQCDTFPPYPTFTTLPPLPPFNYFAYDVGLF